MTNALTQVRVEQSSQPARSPKAKEDQVMRKSITLTIAALFAAGASIPAHAEPKRQVVPVATPTPADDIKADNTRYCVKDTTTGSRLPKKTCKTRADWIADDNFDPLAPQR